VVVGVSSNPGIETFSAISGEVDVESERLPTTGGRDADLAGTADAVLAGAESSNEFVTSKINKNGL